VNWGWGRPVQKASTAAAGDDDKRSTDPGRSHPYEGLNGKCKFCGQPASAKLHRKPVAKATGDVDDFVGFAACLLDRGKVGPGSARTTLKTVGFKPDTPVDTAADALLALGFEPNSVEALRNGSLGVTKARGTGGKLQVFRSHGGASLL
jgi:hypothetical protein